MDEWTTGDIMNFFEKDCRVSVDLVEISKLTGHDMFDGILDDADILTSLGIKSAIDQARVKSALAKLDDKATNNPVDFWEWRAANRRLNDCWAGPMIQSPRSLLIWLRFFQEDGALGQYDHEIDDTSIAIFGLQWFFVPNYPLWRTALQFHDSGWIDNMWKMSTLAALMADVFLLVLFLSGNSKKFTEVLTIRLTVEFGALVLCFVSYYVFWWFVPFFIVDFFFNLNVYLLQPVAACFAIVTQFAALAMVATGQKID